MLKKKRKTNMFKWKEKALCNRQIGTLLSVNRIDKFRVHIVNKITTPHSATTRKNEVRIQRNIYWRFFSVTSTTCKYTLKSHKALTNIKLYSNSMPRTLYSTQFYGRTHVGIGQKRLCLSTDRILNIQGNFHNFPSINNGNVQRYSLI